jgi:hypothetical protein
MIRLRIPFGGAATRQSQPMFGLSLGWSWQDAPGSKALTGYRFVPSLEAGLTLRGQAILILGSVEIRPNPLGGLNAQADGESFCERNLALCLLGGAAAVAIAVLAFQDHSG